VNKYWTNYYILDNFKKRLSMKRKYNVNDDYFNSIDTEAKAYLLGFFIADGYIGLNVRCTNSFRLSIGISDCDENIVNLFRDEICPEIQVRHESYSDKRKPVCKITWTSTKMKETLEKEYNILPRKTYDINFKFPFEKIPKVFIWDFIRGFFDGDGHISYNDKTHVSTFGFYGTSKSFLTQIGRLFEEEFNVKMRIDESKKQNVILYCLRFSANQKRKQFFSRLYEKFYSEKNYFLERKRIKIQKVFSN